MDKKIRVLRVEELLTRDYLFDLAEAVRRVPIGRRSFLEFGTRTLYDWMTFGGTIVTGEGEKVLIYPGVFDAEHSPNSDGEWISDQRNRDYPRRRPAQRLLGRLRLYDAIFRISGLGVGQEARRREVEEARGVLRNFSPVFRARYLDELRKLKREHVGDNAVFYGAAVKRLRIRLAAELAAYKAQA